MIMNRIANGMYNAYTQNEIANVSTGTSLLNNLTAETLLLNFSLISANDPEESIVEEEEPYDSEYINDDVKTV